MPNKWTFTIPPIAQLIKEEMADTRPWIDPFAGMHSPAHVRNDLNPDMPAEYHMDALEFLESLEGQKFAGVLFDPPYSPRQAAKQYGVKSESLFPWHFNTDYFGQCRRKIAGLIEAEGKAVCCWWNSGGIGMNLGFTLDRVLLVAHGGSHNDTIVTVETKVQHTLV